MPEAKLNAAEMQQFFSEKMPPVSQEPIAVFWFRRDLRLEDNNALYQALSSGLPVLLVFVFDSTILSILEDADDRRVNFIHQTLSRIKERLEAMGSSLLCFYGTPEAAHNFILKHYKVKALYANRDYEPYANERDLNIGKLYEQHGADFHLFKDQVIFERDEVLSNSGTPYTVFTPYSKKWYGLLAEKSDPFAPYPTVKYFHQLIKTAPFPMPSLAMMGFEERELDFPTQEPSIEVLKKYAEKRNFPAIKGTTRLSVHMRFGTVSPRAMAALGQAYSSTWMNELVWREFYMNILHHFPHVAEKAFKPAYDQIEWRNNPEEFERWCQGRTGYPIVDAGMRELAQTGFMHNRVRMIVASFLCKHLLIHWSWGERWFARHLLDFDLSANNGGWQWASGSGCDAAPYFRVFNPALQTEKFDPKGEYIRQYVPEFGDPFKYTKPMVEHSFARNRALEAYGSALKGKD